MSRSGYSEDYEDCELFEQAVFRAICGRRGQALLKDMLAALNALPHKRLIANELISTRGEVCAIASVMIARGIATDGYHFDDDPYNCAERIASKLNIATSLAQEIQHLNDEVCECKTPEQRYEYIHSWVRQHIFEEAS